MRLIGKTLQTRGLLYTLLTLSVMAFALAGCLPEEPTPDIQGDTPVVVQTQMDPSPAQGSATIAASDAPTDTPTATETNTLEPSPTLTPTPSPTPTPVAVGPDDFPANINPLTGWPVSDPAILNRPPVLVKVSNFPRGLRPHSGLSFADMVFEYWTGEGTTRFTALYYGQDTPHVGPVRSARLIDASLGQAYQAILLFVSADQFVYGRIINALGQRAISEGPTTCPGLCREGETNSVNNVFANTETMTQFAFDNRGVPAVKPNLNGMRFETLVPDGGKPGSWLQVMYSFYTRSEWRYDPASGSYLRWTETVDENQTVEMVELVDRETGEQLAFNNVVVLFATHNELKPTLHEIVLLGNRTGGRALLFRDGQIYDLVWKSTTSDRPLTFYTADGEVAPFKPGNTWVEVVGFYSAVKELNEGEFEVRLYLP